MTGVEGTGEGTCRAPVSGYKAAIGAINTLHEAVSRQRHGSADAV